MCPPDSFTAKGSHSTALLTCNFTHWKPKAADRWLCSEPCSISTPCLYDLSVDDTEHGVNGDGDGRPLAKASPAVVARMLGRLAVLRRSFVQPDERCEYGGQVLNAHPAGLFFTCVEKFRPSPVGDFCANAKAHGGYLGPWLK